MCAVRFTFSNLPAIGWKLPLRDIVTTAERCEQAGFERFAVADLQYHYDVVAVMTACAMGTRDLVIESLVTNPFTRDAGLLACAYAAVADLSGGRAIFGIGAGVEVPKHVWVSPFGHDRPHPVEGVRECVDVVRRMWRGERVTVDGKVVHVHDAELTCSLPPRIPVLVAARGPKMLELAGEIADIVHLASLFLGPEQRGTELERVASGAARAGREPGSYEIDISVTVSPSRDRSEARRAALRNAAQSILWYAGGDEYARRETFAPLGFSVPRSTVEALSTRWKMWTDPDLPEDLGALITDDVLDQFTVWGTPEECARRLRTVAAEAPGATGFRTKMALPVRRRSLAEYLQDVASLGEVISAYRATETRVVAAGR
jgi:5,10-methylenetetrahydromethanopterin reductase